MISYKKALEALKKNKINIKSEIILSKNSANRICSHDIKSPNNYPAADNTAFDGFEINSKDTNKINQNNSKKFKILKTLAAGDNPKIKTVPKFSTVEVMTGAIIQKPFDTVIPIEQIKYYTNKTNQKYIVIDKKITKNNHIGLKDQTTKRMI